MLKKDHGAQGFTLLELLIVITIIAVVMAVALPRLGDSIGRQEVRGARDAIISQHATARAAAIQTGRQTELRFSGNQVYVQALDPVSRNVDTIGTVQDLYVAHKTTITSSRSAFRFDARGIGREADSTYITITRDGYGQTLVITPWGRIHQ